MVSPLAAASGCRRPTIPIRPGARKPRSSRRVPSHWVLLLVGIVTAKSDHSQAKAQAERSEFRGFLPLTDFYNTPSPLPAGNPGPLIRSEVFDEYELPPGVSAVRILYHSRSALGEDIATSGVVLVPDERPPAGGWPVIAWPTDLRVQPAAALPRS